MEVTKTIHFIAGMPRAGGTRLANLLAQNPRFHTSSPGGMLAMILTVRENWDVLFAATPNEKARLSVMRGIPRSFYGQSAQPVVFDRSPAWLAHLEMFEFLTGHKAKVLVPVRDLRDILASCELLARRMAAQKPGDPFPTDVAGIEARCATWTGNDPAVGQPYTRIEDALARGLRDRMLFVRFDELINRPRETLQKVYAFLGESPFEHNFDHIAPVTGDEDETSEGAAPIHPQVLGKIADKYKGTYLWDQPQWK